MDDTIMLIVEYVIRIIVVVGGSFIIKFIKDRLTKEQKESIKDWTRVAVQAAEMIYREKGSGEIKKKYVFDFIRGKLDDYAAVKVSDEQLDTLIEAVVYEVKKLPS